MIFAKRILFATDLSENSAYALRHVLALAVNTGADLFITHAAEKPSQDQQVTLMMFMQDETTREDNLSHRQSHLEEELRTWLASALADYEITDAETLIQGAEVVEGHPADVIPRRAKALSCDLIAIGSHENTGSFTFLGAVAKRILRKSDIPTMVIPYRKAR